MSTSRKAQHRKPSSATKVRMVALRTAAIGAVAIPATATALEAQAVAKQPQPTQPTEIEPLQHTVDVVTARRAVVAERAQLPTPKIAAKKSTYVYTVQEGDTLAGIAERKIGSADDYPEIFALNKDRREGDGETFGDPSLIMPGWTLDLPGATKVVEPVETESTAFVTKPAVARTVSTTAASTTTAGRSGGTLKDWINTAISVLRQHGYDVSYDAVYETAMHESGGDPRAVNGSDSNAAAGHPSIGLMQTIQSTFDEYALPGYDDIYRPVDNIIAAARYAAAVYGSLDEMVEARCDGSCWRGY